MKERTNYKYFAVRTELYGGGLVFKSKSPASFYKQLLATNNGELYCCDVIPHCRDEESREELLEYLRKVGADYDCIATVECSELFYTLAEFRKSRYVKPINLGHYVLPDDFE